MWQALMRKVDTVMEKLDRLISAPQEEADQHTVLDIREASELLGKSVGTIYSLTSQKGDTVQQARQQTLFLQG